MSKNMIKINKITLNETVDFASGELKKYLRMMMPDVGNVEISYDPQAKDGFRLGLMQDFGLDVSDANDTDLDDIIYIDTVGLSGIIAGDNPRSVLLAVYEYLRQNGCRWLFPGKDGEHIPIKSVDTVKYRHKPDMRYRGPCIEGAESREIILDTIEFLPKVGMNLFMMQFINPKHFYNAYYSRWNNVTLPKRSISAETVMQWKAEVEAEMSKRGIQFHDIGHGWTAAPFGLDITGGWAAMDDSLVPENMRKYLAMLNGERKLFGNRPINTQFCMSSPEARRIVAEYIADFAQQHTNVDYIHVWLADAQNNHCECEECQKKSVSDWYVILLNELDKSLTARGLDTRIVFIAYTETTWAPDSERIENPDRFTLMLAPITRSYTRSLDKSKKIALDPFVRNNISMPQDLDTYLAYFDKWKNNWKGSNVCFEYHFWKHQYYDPSALELSKRIFEDIEAYYAKGLDGLIACGSQRSYFPNGLAYYVFARKQFDLSLTLEEITEDYFANAYGEEWKAVLKQLDMIKEAFGFAYLEGEESEDETRSPYYSPKRAEKLDLVPAITDSIRKIAAAHVNDTSGIASESFRVLSEFADYADMLAVALAIKARGENGYSEPFERLRKHMSEREVYIEKYYDQYFAIEFAHRILTATGKTFSFT